MALWPEAFANPNAGGADNDALAEEGKAEYGTVNNLNH